MKTIKVTVDNANGSREFVVVMAASAEFSALEPGSYGVSQVVKEVVELAKEL